MGLLEGGGAGSKSLEKARIDELPHPLEKEEAVVAVVESWTPSWNSGAAGGSAQILHPVS